MSSSSPCNFCILLPWNATKEMRNHFPNLSCRASSMNVGSIALR